MPFYQMKPVEARQFTGHNADDVCRWVRECGGQANGFKCSADVSRISLTTDRGEVWIAAGWWVIHGLRMQNGKPQFFAMRDDLFVELYDRVEHCEEWEGKPFPSNQIDRPTTIPVDHGGT